MPTTTTETVPVDPPTDPPRRKRRWLKAPPGSQMVLVGADPERFFVPPYVGHKGWIGMRLDNDPDWDEVAVLVGRSYRLVAPKRLSLPVEKHAEFADRSGTPKPRKG